jgi:hypothetical protein
MELKVLMRGIIVATLMTFTTLVVAPSRSYAKEDTVRITINGGDLAAPIEIADPAVVKRYNVWAGRGTSSDEPNGVSIDWTRGIAEPPKGVAVYEVSFVTTRRNPGTYVVRYAIDAASHRGYVYLPGKTDPGYWDNVFLIYRKVEGNWFHAWDEWEKLANPMIEKMRSRR